MLRLNLQNDHFQKWLTSFKKSTFFENGQLFVHILKTDLTSYKNDQNSKKQILKKGQF